jgi:hypothetical protein
MPRRKGGAGAARANQARVGALSHGHLIISGVIDDGAAPTRCDEFRTRIRAHAALNYARRTPMAAARTSRAARLFLAWMTHFRMAACWTCIGPARTTAIRSLDMAVLIKTVSALRNSGISGTRPLTPTGIDLSTLTSSDG